VKAPELHRISPGARRGLTLALVGVAAIWGATFVTVKRAVEHVPVFEFLALRYALAALLLTAICWKQARSLGREGLKAGLVIGAVLFAGYTFQTVGLQYTRASNAGFVTGLFVVIAPILSAIVLRRRPARAVLVGVALAAVGMGLLSLTHGLHVRRGDAIVFGAAVSFAVHIVLLARYAPEHSPAGLAVVQMWVAALAATFAMLVAEPMRNPVQHDVMVGMVITGVFASALAFFIQSLAQRYVSPTRTALILTLEPAFAGLFGIVLLDDVLGTRGWIGAGMILAGMLVAELAPQRAAEG
jgi:drug/metabolite transporter (DMT)-like permease